MKKNSELFVNLKTAKKLKIAGYNLPCKSRFVDEDHITALDNTLSNIEDCKEAKNWNAFKDSVSIPTFKDVIKWLNIKKHAGFMISPNLWSEDQDNPTWIVQSEKPAMYYEGTTDYEETVNNGFQKYVKLLGVE